MKYSKIINKTPQTQKHLLRPDQVKNMAGGYVFPIPPQDQLERFLLLGTEGGTFYAGEQKLTVDNAKSIIAYINTDGPAVVSTVQRFFAEKRLPKMDTGLFVLALAMAVGSAATKQAAYRAIIVCCPTATQLFTLLGDIQAMRGWSRGLRNGIAKWYTERRPENLALQLVKYRQRNGFTHRDALRLCHAKTKSEALNQLFKYAVGKAPAKESGSKLIEAFDKAQDPKMSTPDLAKLIFTEKLTWEMVPTDRLNKPDVLAALLAHMPITALVRNLNRFSRAGMTEGYSVTTQVIVSQLSTLKCDIHPVNVMNAFLTYGSGHGFRGDTTWAVNQRIADALQDLYERSIGAVVPTGKSVLVGVDHSGSMRRTIADMSMSALQFANVLALTFLKSEPHSDVVAFTDKQKEFPFGRRSSLTEVLKFHTPPENTDCSIPIEYALKKGHKYDAIAIITDNESFAGKRHSFECLAEYRKAVNKDVKIIEIATVATPSSQFPNNDRNLLRMVGFDGSVLSILNQTIANKT